MVCNFPHYKDRASTDVREPETGWFPPKKLPGWQGYEKGPMYQIVHRVLHSRDLIKKITASRKYFSLIRNRLIALGEYSSVSGKGS